ncbi:hypothetical protein [Arthrobacter sp.]|uniref:hypothetical protein n=1 Tax=Arthrobacter sp. TaxID=1667 RepID=UPI003A901CBB
MTRQSKIKLNRNLTMQVKKASARGLNHAAEHVLGVAVENAPSEKASSAGPASPHSTRAT